MARGLRNEFIERWNASALTHLPYPWQNALTQPMRRAASAAQSMEAAPAFSPSHCVDLAKNSTLRSRLGFLEPLVRNVAEC
jgi:hypothetical protein